MSSMVEYYRDRYASVENSPGLETEPTFRARVDYALRKIGKRSARILDFGCNTGSAARYFVEAGHEVVGVDISQSAVRIARRNVPQATFCQADSESSLALPSASFDVCYCSEVIEHLFNVRGFVAEVHRLLKDGGMFVLTTPYHGWLKNILVVSLRFDQHFSPTGGHIRFFSKTSMRQCLEQGGFLAEEITGTGRMWPLWNSLLITARKTDEKQ